METEKERQFRSNVRLRAGLGLSGVDLPAWALEKAINHYIRKGQTGGQYEEECIELAGEFAAQTPQERRETAQAKKKRPRRRSKVRRDEPLVLPRTSATILDSEMLAEAIRPDIEEIRRVIFGDTRPPFKPKAGDGATRRKAWARAAAWIEDQAKRQSPSPKDLGRVFALQREIEEKSRELARLVEAEAPPFVMPRRRTLFYLKPSDPHGVAAIDVDPSQGPLPESPEAWTKWVRGAPLWYLERKTRELAEETGFARAAVLDYVLTGTLPLLPPATVSVRRIYGRSADRYIVPDDPEKPVRPLRLEAHITVHARDLVYSQVRELYRALRARLAVVQKKRSAIDKDAKLFRLVGELGGPPNRPAGKEFWSRGLKEWNRRNPEWRVKTWRALMMRWMRLKKCWPVASRISGAPD